MSHGNQGMASRKFVFRKHANIGAADAIEDRKFLEQSFVDNGSIDILTDMDNPMCIVLGRTGSGKTALIERIQATKERTIQIHPEGLALTYISTNDVLRFFMEAGVNLDLFYRLLWRHVFAVEIIRQHYNIVNEEQSHNFWTNILQQMFTRDRSKQEAIEYLRKWGKSFWLESEYRVQEITQTLEKDLTAALDAKASPPIPGLTTEIGFNVGTAKKLTEEQKGEVVRRGQEIVNKVQMKTLSKIMELLETDLLGSDRQKRYFITIDRLDENWVHDEFRYGLIKALIDTVRDFNHSIRNVKIIVAIREDLLDRVFRYTRGIAGYQEEKYRSMYMPLRWTTEELEVLLDRRVNQLIREQYTTQPVKLKELFPEKVNKINPIDYFFERTMLRPRDAILFFNECIRAAEGHAKFSQTMILQAEAFYSENRLRALADEWAADYPNLFDLALFLKKHPVQFRVLQLNENIEENALRFVTSDRPQDQIYHLVMSKFESGDMGGLIQELLRILFRVGVVGIKPETFAAIQWSYLGQKLTATELSTDAIVKIHPAFWRVLGSQPI